jgi:ribbon-helix-helix protein, copG family
MSKQRSIRFDAETNERLEQLIATSKKTVSEVIRDLVMEGVVQVSTRIGDKAIQEALVRYHHDMNENYLHTNAKLERVEQLITRLGERVSKSQHMEDLLYSVESHLVKLRQDLAEYRQQGNKEASEIVNLQR